jgi:hypothetical protein
MGGRYLVSGAQLGELITLSRLDGRACNDKLNEICDTQRIFDSDQALEDDIEALREEYERHFGGPDESDE